MNRSIVAFSSALGPDQLCGLSARLPGWDEVGGRDAILGQCVAKQGAVHGQSGQTARVHMLSDRHAGMFTSHHARAIVGSPYFSNSRLSASASSAACERFSFTAKMASCCRTVGSK